MFILSCRRKRCARGFTLIEILVVIGMLAILSTVVLVAVNPLRQFAQARNAQRRNDVSAILDAVSDRIADHGGEFLSTNPIYGADACGIGLPATATPIGKEGLNLRPCLVSKYISELPYDPSNGSNSCTTDTCNGSNEDYATDYTVMQDPNTSRITVCAPGAAESALGLTQPFCLSR